MVIWETLLGDLSRPSKRKKPDAGFICDGRFLDSFLAQMIAYRLPSGTPPESYCEGGSINVEAVSLGSWPNACSP